MFTIIKITALLYLAAFIISFLVAGIIKLMYMTTQSDSSRPLSRQMIQKYMRAYHIRSCRRNRFYKELDEQELYFYGCK